MVVLLVTFLVVIIIVAVVIAVTRRATPFATFPPTSAVVWTIARRRAIGTWTTAELAATFTSRRRAIGTAEAATRAFTAESRPRRTIEDSAFNTALKSAATWRRARRTGWRRWRHVLVHEVGQRLEFVFAQLVVFVLIELSKQFFWLRQFRRASGAAFRTAAIGTTLTFRSAAAIAAPTLWTAATAIATQLAHFFAGLLALFVAQLAIAVFVKFLDYLLAPFDAWPVVGLLCFLVLVAVFGPRRHCQQAHGQEDNTRHEIPHVGVTLSDW